MKKYWHEISDEEASSFLKTKPSWDEVHNRYSEPDWCDLKFESGCFSLLGDNRCKISMDYCKGCSFFKNNIH